MQQSGKSQHSSDAETRRRFGPVRILLAGLALVLLVSGGGFAVFTDRSRSLVAPHDAKADGIVVLTGGAARISAAVKLLENRQAKRLLISGVYPQTTAARLRKLTGAKPETFACCVDLDKRAPDTRGNALEAAKWSRKHGFTSLLVVTSNYHMLRAMHEFARTMPETDLVAFPVRSAPGEETLDRPASIRLWLNEYVKYLLSLVRP